MDSNQSFPEQRPSASRTMSRRKSPPPTFINLDDCKPILATTTTNTSTNSSSRGTTAFVFTSSRTLRALQDQEDRRGSPRSPLVPSPATPPSPSRSSSCASTRRAQLTITQLTKHSEGAIDARALIGPKMRAAGFVNLPHTFASRSEAGFPGALSPVSCHFSLMPTDPPNFPPILFVNPSVAATLPWEYQREVPWSYPSTTRATEPSGQPSSETASNEPTPGAVPASSPLPHPPPAPPPLHRDNMPGSSGSSGSELSGLFSSSGSSSTLFSSQSSPSMGLTSVEETDEEESEVGHKGKARVKELEPLEFPFPPAYEPPQSPKSVRSHGSRASSVTASPTVYAGPVPGTRTFSSVQFSTASSPSTHRQDIRIARLPPPLLPSPALKEALERPKTKEKPSQLPARSFITAKPAKSQRQYSLTELCDSSPLVWLTTSDIFVPPAPIARSPIRASSLTPSSLSISASRPRPAVEAPPHRRHATAPDTVPTLASTTERHHRIPSAPLRHHLILSKHIPVSSDQDSGETKASRGGKLQDLAKDSSRAGGAEIHRWSDGVAAADSKSRGQESAGSGTGTRARGRDTRGKFLGASEAEKERAAAGKTQPELEQARQGLTAAVLAHRERDREHARHVAADRDRDKLVKQKQRAHGKLRGNPLRDDAQSESESTMVDQPFTAVKTID